MESRPPQQADLVPELLRYLARGEAPEGLFARFPELLDPAAKRALEQAAARLDHDDEWILSELIEHIPEMIFIKDAQDLRFVRVNRAGEAIMGIPRQELVGATDHDFFPAPEADFFQGKDREVIESGCLVDIPKESIQTRNGPRYLHTQKLPLRDLHGRVRFLAGISRDITEFVKAQEEVVRSHRRLRELSRLLQSAQEEERRRLAREIHDELGQVLTGLKIELTWLDNHLPEQLTDLASHLEQANLLVNSALSTVRRVATQLRPQILDDLGLHAALDWLLQEVCGRADVRSELQFDVPYKVDREMATTIFRCCQEALTNVVRHAQAQAVQLLVHHDPDYLQVEVRDDGVGCQPAADSNVHCGLVGIRERVQLHGGSMEIVSDQGTTLLLRLPHSSE